MKRYIKLESGYIVDTTILMPHTESYHIKDTYLYAEQINGDEILLGKIAEVLDYLNEL